ncbi:hypothetical protein EP7_005676 (plasmid) [Isosphaeraceae bacterium EP7]
MSNEQLTELVERLALHADIKLFRLRWRGISASGGAVPCGIEPGDLASEVILDLLKGKRSWHPQAILTY